MHIPRRAWKYLLVAAACLGVVLAVYGRSLPYPFVYDDLWTIVRNPSLRSVRPVHRFFTDRDTPAHPAAGMGDALYRPLPTLSFALERAAGLSAPGMRLTNLILHGLNGALVWGWLFALGVSPAGASVGGALFLLHPAQVETVVWVTQRSNLMACAGVLAALLLLARGRSRRRWAAALACFAAGLLSKETAIVFPALLVMQDLARLPRRAPAWTDRWRGYAAVLLTAGAYLALRASVVGAPVQRDFRGGGFWGSLLLGAVSWLEYLKVLLWPTGLRVSRFQYVSDPWHSFWPLAGLVLLALFTAAAVRFSVRDRRGGFFLLWIPVVLSPVLGFFPTDTFVAERFLYLPLAGAAGAAALLWDKGGARVRGALLAAVVLMAAGAVVQTGDWRSERALWGAAAAQEPENAFARLSLGDALAEAGERMKAETAYKEALRLGLTRPLAGAAMGSLARLRLRAGDPAGALRWANKALRALPDSIQIQRIRSEAAASPS